MMKESQLLVNTLKMAIVFLVIFIFLYFEFLNFFLLLIIFYFKL